MATIESGFKLNFIYILNILRNNTDNNIEIEIIYLTTLVHV